MKGLSKHFAKAALHKASFFSVTLVTLCGLFISACGDLGPDPNADGARFNAQFRYYWTQDCRYDSFGAYDCGPILNISPSMKVGLRVDSDGLAYLNLDGSHYYYLESAYDEGYDPDYGPYFHFYQDEDELTIYKDGSEMAWWKTDKDSVTYYFYELY